METRHALICFACLLVSCLLHWYPPNGLCSCSELNGSANLGFGAGPHLGMGGADGGDVGFMLQMLQQPGVQQAMQSLMAQPQVLQTMMNSNPQMRSMVDQNPQVR